MKNLYIFLFALLMINSANTQPCLPEGITFTTQEQIDNFQTNYPGCMEIDGNVTINGDNITNLNGLSVLTAIDGGFLIGDTTYPIGGNPSLVSLTGLENLTSIGGYLRISGNYNLTSLSGFDNLTSIGGGLEIGNSTALNSLTGLESMTSIGGDIWIYSNYFLTSLSGLGSLTSIGGYLEIGGNDALNNMFGLENLTSIGGYLNILFNNALTSLTGLENLIFISGDLAIYNNNALTNLSGLESLTSVGGGLYIWQNFDALTSLSGLESLTSIGGDLSIEVNPFLTSLSGLESLTSIGGELRINVNNALTSLSGLESLNSIGGELWITNNQSLSTCNVQGLCNSLLNPAGSINVFNNAPGCDNPPEVAANCGFIMPCMPFGNYYFRNQTEIDNFQINYPGCSEIEGDVTIGHYGCNISNLNGLNVLISIGGSLVIVYNDSLISLFGMQNLTTIGGYILIGYNNSLTSLFGLENIEANSIDSLAIVYNPVLSECDVQSVCDYIFLPGAAVNLYNNDSGCNTLEEIEEHCFTKIEDQTIKNEIIILPNPSNIKITISLPSLTGNTLLSIFNVSGEKVLEMQLTDNKTQIDISALPRGVYFVRLQNEMMVEVGKMVKE